MGNSFRILNRQNNLCKLSVHLKFKSTFNIFLDVVRLFEGRKWRFDPIFLFNKEIEVLILCSATSAGKTLCRCKIHLLMRN